MLAASEPLDDSGYEGTPAKKGRPETLPEAVPGSLIDELERGYEVLQLCKPGALQRSYEMGLPPPQLDSTVRVSAALGLTPGSTRNIRSQLDRVANYRNFGSPTYPIVDLTLPE